MEKSTKVADYVVKYREEGYNCAESTLMAANEAWDLGLTTDQMLIMGGFGGGMGTGDACGAITGGVAALSLKYAVNTGHESPLLMKKVRLYIQTVRERLKFIDCKDLGPIYRTKDPTLGCALTVLLITRILDEIDEMEVDAPAHQTGWLHGVGMETLVNNPRWVLVDDREPEYYHGKLAERDGKRGHIESAVNFPFSLFKTLSEDEILQKFEQLGITRDKYVCAYDYTYTDCFKLTEFLYEHGYTHNCHVYDLKLWAKDLVCDTD